jgi:hypothetical protein
LLNLCRTLGGLSPRPNPSLKGRVKCKGPKARPAKRRVGLQRANPTRVVRANPKPFAPASASRDGPSKRRSETDPFDGHSKRRLEAAPREARTVPWTVPWTVPLDGPLDAPTTGPLFSRQPLECPFDGHSSKGPSTAASLQCPQGGPSDGRSDGPFKEALQATVQRPCKLPQKRQGPALPSFSRGRPRGRSKRPRICQ